MSLAAVSPRASSKSTNPYALSPSTVEQADESSSSISSTPMLGQTWFLLEQERRDVEASSKHKQQWLFVLPVLLLEFLAIALTRAVLPSILLQEYGSRVYIVLGSADCIRGLLAFFACPLFGKLSDLWGRKKCLLVTVVGTCAPVCSLALFSWEQITATIQQATSSIDTTDITGTTDASQQQQQQQRQHSDNSDDETRIHYSLPPSAIPIFVLLLCLSGIFSSTFTLVFAYISDSVQERNERVSAFGLALA